MDTTPAGELLWPPTGQVIIPGAGVAHSRQHRSGGFQQRATMRVRVSDYKTGAEPAKASEIVLGRGAELQRVLYALAARQLVPDNPRIIARLVFLGDRSAQAIQAARCRSGDRRHRRACHARPSISYAAASPCPVPMHARTGTTSRWRCRRRRRFISRANRQPSAAPSATSPGSGARDDEARRRSRAPAGAHRTAIRRCWWRRRRAPARPR